MNSTPEPSTFDAWVRWVFDHPVTNPEWYFDDCQWPESNDSWPYKDGAALPAAALVLDFITRLFEAPTGLRDQYSLAQLGQGLWFIASGIWRPMTTVFDANLPLVDRQRCVRSFESLNRLIFAANCERALSHVRSPANPLNIACYMWWDILPWGDFVEFVNDEGQPPNFDEIESCHEKINEANLAIARPIHLTMLDVMRAILRVDHLACQESALHGLGHFHEYYPTEVVGIIDEFLRQVPTISQDLRTYAQNAAIGAVQ